jgi:hypothetical protein
MFTNREQVADIYGVVRGMGRAKVRGADADEVRAARIDTCDRAERAINAALAGPERNFVGEPGDDQLEQMLRHVARIRAALQPAT